MLGDNKLWAVNIAGRNLLSLFMWLLPTARPHWDIPLHLCKSFHIGSPSNIQNIDILFELSGSGGGEGHIQRTPTPLSSARSLPHLSLCVLLGTL